MKTVFSELKTIPYHLPGSGRFFFQATLFRVGAALASLQGDSEFACNAGDLDSIPELGRSPGGGHDNLLQYSCLEKPHGQRSLVGYSLWGHKESDMTERLSTAQPLETFKTLASCRHLSLNSPSPAGPRQVSKPSTWLLGQLYHQVPTHCLNLKISVSGTWEFPFLANSPVHLKQFLMYLNQHLGFCGSRVLRAFLFVCFCFKITVLTESHTLCFFFFTFVFNLNPHHGHLSRLIQAELPHSLEQLQGITLGGGAIICLPILLLMHM